MIDSFNGEYRWLSNFSPCSVKWGLTFPSVEHAYQAAKCANKQDMQAFTSGTAASAKRKGRQVVLRPDWERVKLQVMEYLLRQKFRPGSQLANQLLATGNEQLVEGNTWGDRYWGVCNGVGENNLGKLLMKLREELRVNLLQDNK